MKSTQKPVEIVVEFTPGGEKASLLTVVNRLLDDILTTPRVGSGVLVSTTTESKVSK